MNTHAALFQIFFGDRGWNAQACPIGSRNARRQSRLGDDVTAVDQALECLVDEVGRIFLAKLTRNLGEALAGADRVGNRAIEFAVQKELPVFAIETHCLWRQNVDRKMRRELRDALELRRALVALTGHGTGSWGRGLLAACMDRHR